MARCLIDPMLAIGSTGASGRAAVDLATLVDSGNWILDTKIDGERAIIDGGRVYNRRGVDVTHVWPEIALPAGTFDGEIVTLDGKFESTLLRSSQSAPHAIRRLAEERPARFIAFDLPGSDKPWLVRRNALESMQDAGEIEMLTPISSDMTLWDHTRELGMEGVIAKRTASKYRGGKRSTDWVKFKHLHRITCVAYGYEPGNGSRAHFGAMKVALIGPDGVPTPVGRVGSGFTGRQIDTMKALLDTGQMPVVEIECTHVTSGGTLRFPVYRGQRSDVAAVDCTTSQLNTIPRTS